ncbi:hypothetical protein TNCV_903461 [Trichonephila clavipes]|nr:hypothetical protein TNCV_903461 [Trichonephila clavipes]
MPTGKRVHGHELVIDVVLHRWFEFPVSLPEDPLCRIDRLNINVAPFSYTRAFLWRRTNALPSKHRCMFERRDDTHMSLLMVVNSLEIARFQFDFALSSLDRNDEAQAEAIVPAARKLQSLTLIK